MKTLNLFKLYTRMYNLVKDVEYTGVNSDLLKEDAEKALFEAASKASESSAAWEAGDYDAVVAVPATFSSSHQQIPFEDVMVMDKDGSY